MYVPCTYFSIDNLTSLLSACHSVQPLQSFTTTHTLVLYAWRGLDQQYGFPFDGYQLETTFLAFDDTTNASVPILGLRIISSTDNFTPLLRYDEPTVTFNASVVSADAYDAGSTAGRLLGRTMEIGLQRSGFAKTYVMTLWVVNWGLTAVVAFITVSAVAGREVGESILLLPISVILTIPALRALWDGAPAFGECPSFIMTCGKTDLLQGCC